MSDNDLEVTPTKVRVASTHKRKTVKGRRSIKRGPRKRSDVVFIDRYVAQAKIVARTLIKAKQRAEQRMSDNPLSSLNQLLPHEKLFVLLYAVQQLPLAMAYKISHTSQYGYTMNTESQIEIIKDQAEALITKPTVQSAITAIYDNAGLSLEKLAETVGNALNAKKTMTDKETGEVEETDIPDHAIRLKAVKLAHEVRGELGANRAKDPQVNLNIDLSDSDHSIEDIESAVGEVLNEKYRKKKRTKLSNEIIETELSSDS